MLFFFFFKQKTAYEMRISDWSSDVCSSDLQHLAYVRSGGAKQAAIQSDGAYRVRPGSYGRETAGRIPRNIQKFAMSAADMNKAYREYCERHGLVRHGASMPVRLANDRKSTRPNSSH